MWKRERSERSALDDMMAETAKSYSPPAFPPPAMTPAVTPAGDAVTAAAGPPVGSRGPGPGVLPGGAPRLSAPRCEGLGARA